MKSSNDTSLDYSLKHMLNENDYKIVCYGQHIMKSKDCYLYDYHTEIEHKDSRYRISIYREGKASRFYEDNKGCYFVKITDQLNNEQISHREIGNQSEHVIKHIVNKLYIFNNGLDLLKEFKDRYTNVFVKQDNKICLLFIADNKFVSFIIRYEDKEYKYIISLDGHDRAERIANNKIELINNIEDRLIEFNSITEGIRSDTE